MAPAGKKTLETLGAADSIAEALEMAANERQRHEVSHMLLTAHSPDILSSKILAWSIVSLPIMAANDEADIVCGVMSSSEDVAS